MTTVRFLIKCALKALVLWTLQRYQWPDSWQKTQIVKDCWKCPFRQDGTNASFLQSYISLNLTKNFWIESSFAFSRFHICFYYRNSVETLLSWSFLDDSSLFCVQCYDRLYDKGACSVCVIYKTSQATKFFRFQIDANNCQGFEIIAFNLYS